MRYANRLAAPFTGMLRKGFPHPSEMPSVPLLALRTSERGGQDWEKDPPQRERVKQGWSSCGVGGLHDRQRRALLAEPEHLGGRGVERGCRDARRVNAGAAGAAPR